MNYKGLFKSVLGLALVMVLGTFMSSCGEDTPPAPTVKLFITTDGNTVDIAAEATNETSWSWEYGNGDVSDSVGSHTYTYLENGTYTIKCTVTGEGGSATASETVTIESMKNLLTSHPWVMSNAGANGLGFHISPELILDFPVADILGTLNSLIDDASDMVYDFTNEYKDTYTFSADGSYDVDYENNNVLTSWVYAPLDKLVGTCKYVGMFAVSQEPLQGATWTLHENEDLTLHTVYDADGDNADGVAETVTFENADFITFTNGGFLGVKDYTSTVLIRSIKSDELEVTIFFHGYNDGVLGIDEPSFILNFTFKAK